MEQLMETAVLQAQIHDTLGLKLKINVAGRVERWRPGAGGTSP